MSEINGSIISSGLPTVTSFYPFIFSMEGGFPQLQLNQYGKWKFVQEKDDEPEPFNDREAGEFIRAIGKAMIEKYERERQSHAAQ